MTVSRAELGNDSDWWPYAVWFKNELFFMEPDQTPTPFSTSIRYRSGSGAVLEVIR